MSSKGEENSKRRKRIMKKTYRNMALAAACVLTATGLWGCSTSVQIPDTVKVQQGDSSDNRITERYGRSKGSAGYGPDPV